MIPNEIFRNLMIVSYLDIEDDILFNSLVIQSIIIDFLDILDISFYYIRFIYNRFISHLERSSRKF